MDVRFPPDTLTFLRALKRNNTREWFAANKARYDASVRAPMIAVIERLSEDFRAFAPELVATPKVSLFRIYRDTRFSADKTPYKTHVSAVFPHRALARHQGAGLYLEVSPARVFVAGGMYAPSSPDLLAVREQIARQPRQFRSIVESPAFRRLGGLSGDRLTRVPRGFPADHPAVEYLKQKQFLAWREFPAEHATAPGFYRSVRTTFEQIYPLIRFLNEPLTGPAVRRPGVFDP